MDNRRAAGSQARAEADRERCTHPRSSHGAALSGTRPTRRPRQTAVAARARVGRWGLSETNSARATSETSFVPAHRDAAGRRRARAEEPQFDRSTLGGRLGVDRNVRWASRTGDRLSRTIRPASRATVWSMMRSVSSKMVGHQHDGGAVPSELGEYVDEIGAAARSRPANGSSRTRTSGLRCEQSGEDDAALLAAAQLVDALGRERRIGVESARRRAPGPRVSAPARALTSASTVGRRSCSRGRLERRPQTVADSARSG